MVQAAHRGAPLQHFRSDQNRRHPIVGKPALVQRRLARDDRRRRRPDVHRRQQRHPDELQLYRHNYGYPGNQRLPAFSPDGQTIPRRCSHGTLGKVGDACNCETFPYNLNTQARASVDNMDEVQGGYSLHNGFLHATYDITVSLWGFVRGMYGKDDSNGRWQSAAPLESWAVPVGLDNPFLSAQERTVIGNALATNFPNTVGALAGSAPGTRFVYPGNDALATQYFTDNVFLNNQPGNPLECETRQITINNTYQGTAGFKAKLFGWNIDGYGEPVETYQDYIDTNGTRTDRLFFAMDAVVDPTGGQAVCRDGLIDLRSALLQELRQLARRSACSAAGAISRRLRRRYVSGPTKYAHQIYGLTNGELNANGSIFSGIGAGDWKMAVGISYRKVIFPITPLTNRTCIPIPGWTAGDPLSHSDSAFNFSAA